MECVQFITAIPWNVQKGSGCYVGTRTLVDGIERSGIPVRLVSPQIITPFFTTTRILFNESLRWRNFDCAATVGIDADGYAIPQGRNSPPHVACIKGVLGDAVHFESGVTRASLALHAGLEKRHAQRADLVITISRYCAERLDELYGVRDAVVVPELIDLEAWRARFAANPARPRNDRFVVLSVCRFYPRKRLDVLLRAAALLRDAIPALEVRIAGGGPERARLTDLWRELRLESTVRWLGDISLSQLATEYNGCDVFCLPSVQEGFGIVLLEAMAAGKPIVAARAAAIPEVVPHGMLAEPGDVESFAENIGQLYEDPKLRDSLAAAGRQHVIQYGKGRVARQFIQEVGRVAGAWLETTKTHCPGRI